MKSGMKRKNLLSVLLLVAVAFVVLLIGGLKLNQNFESRLAEERKNQLNELTAQVSATFENALDFQWIRTEGAEKVFREYTYASAEEIEVYAGRIADAIGITDEDILMFLDEDGRCYDENGEHGIWGDFDQVTGTGEKFTFISDSVTYDGVRWAFAKKLSEPVETTDGETSIRYVVLLRPVDAMSGYYYSEAYQDVCETYILKENGTRMYDSIQPDDTIQSRNIYKTLRETESTYGESLDTVLAELSENKVAVDFYVSPDDGAEYCYALTEIGEYEIVLLYLIPVDSVAMSTVSMASSMMRSFFMVATMVMVLVFFVVFVSLRLNYSRQIGEQQEKSLKEIEQMNAQLAESNRSLEAAKRSAESALDIARSANRAKSSFLSNMSHDIRTPLNAIIGFLTLLERDADDGEKVRKYAGKIGISSRHLLSLINDILDMSRIESGKTSLNRDYFAMDEFIENVTSIITPQVNAKNQSFTVEKTGLEDMIVLSDRLRLTQILMNLLSNAVKYTQDGGTILLKVTRLAGKTNRLATMRFVVQDNGIGMSEEFQKRIFEPFERETTSTKSGVEGTGLGMAITKNLVDLMGGIIVVDSKPGEGSTFTLELAFHTETKEETAARLAGHPVEADAFAADGEWLAPEESAILRDRHFLVAEDNSINAEIIVELMGAEGATCVIAGNGEEAVRLFTEAEPGTFDAIFMDIQMPVMDGYDAARAIRESGCADALTIPIAAMTANAFAEDVQKALDAGMNAHIAKPVDMGKVKEFIANELLGGGRGRR